MDTIDLGNNESLVCGVFPNQDGTFTAMTYTKSKSFKPKLAHVAGLPKIPAKPFIGLIQYSCCRGIAEATKARRW
ncbi:ydfA [Escherichia coli]|nr:ydfA [Escherichia coli]